MSATIEQVTEGLQGTTIEAGDVHVSEAIENRAERKSRKGLQGLGLVRVPGIARITMRRSRGHLYVISQPEVYKSATADSYVIFGEGKVENPAQQQAALQAAQQQQLQLQQLQQAAAEAQGGAGGDFSAQAEALLAQNKESKAKEAEDEEPVDAEGLNEGDIELVMTQANLGRNAAIKALKAANGDLVRRLRPSASYRTPVLTEFQRQINAIMEATSA